MKNNQRFFFFIFFFGGGGGEEGTVTSLADLFPFGKKNSIIIIFWHIYFIS